MSNASDRRSAPTDTSAPDSCACAIDRPQVAHFATGRPGIARSHRTSSTSKTIASIGTMRRSMPSGSALDRRTSSVCGKQPSLTRHTIAIAAASASGASAVHQRHRFRRRRRLVQQRCVRHFHPRQIRDHRLEVEERLQAALGDLGLVRRVRRVPARVLHHHPENHARREGVVVTQADVGPEDLVSVRQVPKTVADTVARFRLVEGSAGVVEADRGGDDFVHQRVERWSTDRLEASRRVHPPTVRCAGARTSRWRPVSSSRAGQGFVLRAVEQRTRR